MGNKSTEIGLEKHDTILIGIDAGESWWHLTWKKTLWWFVEVRV